jgi:hypothetical protein
MSVNGGVGIHMATSEIKPCFYYLHKSCFCIKTKYRCIRRKEVEFFFATLDWFLSLQSCVGLEPRIPTLPCYAY